MNEQVLQCPTCNERGFSVRCIHGCQSPCVPVWYVGAPGKRLGTLVAASKMRAIQMARSEYPDTAGLVVSPHVDIE